MSDNSNNTYEVDKWYQHDGLDCPKGLTEGVRVKIALLDRVNDSLEMQTTGAALRWFSSWTWKEGYKAITAFKVISYPISAKKMTLAEISKELGYPVKLV
jgi:hypothetical protein